MLYLRENFVAAFVALATLCSKYYLPWSIKGHESSTKVYIQYCNSRNTNLSKLVSGEVAFVLHALAMGLHE